VDEPTAAGHAPAAHDIWLAAVDGPYVSGSSQRSRARSSCELVFPLKRTTFFIDSVAMPTNPGYGGRFLSGARPISIWDTESTRCGNSYMMRLPWTWMSAVSPEWRLRAGSSRPLKFEAIYEEQIDSLAHGPSPRVLRRASPTPYRFLVIVHRQLHTFDGRRHSEIWLRASACAGPREYRTDARSTRSNCTKHAGDVGSLLDTSSLDPLEAASRRDATRFVSVRRPGHTRPEKRGVS